MKKNILNKLITAITRPHLLGPLAVAACMAATALPALADDDDKPQTYTQTNLVSNLPGVAQLQDTNLVNAWGISFSPNTPFWVSDNNANLATLYVVTNDMAGNPTVIKQGLQVAIAGDGFPTGQLFNTTSNFNGDLFIFAGEDGFITGWRPALGTNTEILVARSNAVYKGILLDTNTGSPLLVAANFREATVDVYDANTNLTQFADPKASEGYAPFNVAHIGGLIFVSFAKQDAPKHDNLAGPGTGLIDVFNPATGKFHRFATGSDAGGHLKELNAPWGMALAPESFGKHEDELLVGNFGSGTIMTFNAEGEFRGFLEDTHHHPIVIDGLWALVFGNGTKAGVPSDLYFSAGPDGETNGLFGSIVPTPAAKKDKNKGKDKDKD